MWRSLLFVCVCLTFLPGCQSVVSTHAKASTSLTQDRRTPGTMIEDNTIQNQTPKAIRAAHSNNKSTHVSAATYNLQVLLVGQAPDRQTKKQIEKNIRQIKRVAGVHNEITIEPPISITRRTQDSWITTKVKTEMGLHKAILPAHVKVTTENGIVYLMGIVTIQEEAAAVEIARQTAGVKKVIKVFEYAKA